MKNTIKSIKQLLILFVSLLAFLSSNAQGSIKLSGKVVNQRNQPISGATISVAGQRSISANAEGGFVLSLPAGTYTLTISAVGYQSKEITDVEVKPNLDNVVDVVLNDRAEELEGVVVRVTRRQESTNTLLTFQRNNTALSSGLAADFIRRTPDRNTSEVLKRVSGASVQDNKYVVVRGLADRYNQAIINNAQLPSTEPDKKAFSFDVIPSGMIDNIIINKTATPDLTGEFAGGLVQINTKGIPTENVLSIGLSLGFNTQSTFRDFTSNPRNSTDWLGFDNGNRAFPKNVPSVSGYRSSTDAQKVNHTLQFKDQVYGEVTTTALPITTLNLAWANVSNFKNGAKFGTVVAAYYRQSMLVFGENADVERGRWESVRTPIFTGTETQNRYAINGGALANFTYSKGKTKVSFKNLFNQLFEDNYFSRQILNTGRLQDVQLRGSFLNQRSLYSGQLEAEHTLNNRGTKLKLNGNFAYNWKTQPDFRVAQYVKANNQPNAKYDLDDDDSRRFFSDLKDYSYGVNGFIEQPFKLGGQKQLVKAGGSTLIRVRDFRARVLRYRPASLSTDLTKPFDQMFLANNINLNGVYLDDQTQNTDKYFAASALSAGYVMFDNKLGDKLRLIWGVRAEMFQQFLNAVDLSLKRVVVNTEKLDILPSLNATYQFNNKHQVRLSGSQTVARPEFREIAPFQFFDYEQIWGIGGNPDLKRTSIINVDGRYEWYPKAGEVISFGAFYKKFSNPIELRMDPGSNGDRWLFNYANAESANLFGVEVELRKNLEFLGAALKDITFISNLTYLDSKVTLNTQTSGGTTSIAVDRPLYGQSPYLINAGFQYTKNTWNASLLYNRIGPRLFLVGDPPPFGAGFYDIYEAPRNVLDIQVSKKVMKKQGEVKLTVSDLINNRYLFYDNPSGKTGYSFEDGDRINFAYRPGTTISLGFTYDFKLSKK